MFDALHKTSHKDVLRPSRVVDEEAKRDARAELAVVLLIKGEFICSIPVKPSHLMAGI